MMFPSWRHHTVHLAVSECFYHKTCLPELDESDLGLESMRSHSEQSGVHLTGCERRPQAPVWGKAAWWSYSSPRKHLPSLLSLPALQLSSLQRRKRRNTSRSITSAYYSWLQLKPTKWFPILCPQPCRRLLENSKNCNPSPPGRC